MAKNITVSATIKAPVQKAWTFWTLPEHIIQWNNASGDWHTLRATNEQGVGVKLTSRMEARDGCIYF